MMLWLCARQKQGERSIHYALPSECTASHRIAPHGSQLKWLHAVREFRASVVGKRGAEKQEEGPPIGRAALKRCLRHLLCRVVPSGLPPGHPLRHLATADHSPLCLPNLRSLRLLQPTCCAASYPKQLPRKLRLLQPPTKPPGGPPTWGGQTTCCGAYYSSPVAVPPRHLLCGPAYSSPPPSHLLCRELPQTAAKAASPTPPRRSATCCSRRRPRTHTALRTLAAQTGHNPPGRDPTRAPAGPASPSCSAGPRVCASSACAGGKNHGSG